MSTQEPPHADRDDNTEDGSARTMYASAKRRIATLEQQLKTLQEGGTKPKSYVSVPESY